MKYAKHTNDMELKCLSVERRFFLQLKGSRNIQYTVLKVSGFTYTRMAWWLSWLERRPVTAEVEGSNPFRVVSLVCYKILLGS